MLTAEIIRSVAPRARQDYIDAIVGGEAVLKKYGIDTPMRLAQFMATISHESGGMTLVEESGNYTSASRIRKVWSSRPEAAKFVRNPKGLFNSVYGSRMGNERNGINDDDGWRYRGRGLIQLTGRDSYEAAGRAIGLDLGGKPELLGDANISLQVACWEFSGFVKLCDKGESGFRAVSNGINRGNPFSSYDPIDWPKRQIWLRKWLDVLDVPGQADDVIDIGSHGPLVSAFQERLRALGYASGRVDGVFGPRMRAAVLAFQAENDIETDGRIGSVTRTALNSEAARSMPIGERGTETADDLRAAGSETIASTDKIKDGVKTIAVISAPVAAAKETGVLDAAGSWLGEFTLLKTTMTGIADILSWAAGKWYIFVIVGCYLLYRVAKRIELSRLVSHRLGFDVSR